MAISVQIQSIDLNEFKKIIQEVIGEEIEKLRTDLRISKDIETIKFNEPLLSMKDAASFMKITTVSLYKYVKEGNIKTYRVGKRRKFRKNDLENYMLNKKGR